jgi:nicotinamidase-related amidase
MRGTTKILWAVGDGKVLIAGIVTEVCVAFPALSAREEGYEVFVATDASGHVQQDHA